MIEVHHHPIVHAVEIRNLLKGPSLAPLRSLSVGCMKDRNIPGAMPLARNGRAHARVHSPAQQHHRFSLVAHRIVFFPCFFTSLLHYLFPYTPFVAGSQMNLCSCNPSRTGKPSVRIHSASWRGSSPGHFPSGSSNTGENKT